MTIVYCIFSLVPPGGMQRTLTVKANYLADVAGHQVHIITRAENKGTPHFELSPTVKVHQTGGAYKSDLAALLHKIKPDITISLYGEEAKFLYKIKDGSKKILEFHFTRNHLVHLVKGLPNVKFRKLRLSYARWLQYQDVKCARHYDRLVLLTEADKELWGKPANAVVIPNPLSFSTPVKSDLNSQKVLSVGRLIATKGFDLLIDAYRLVAIKHPYWKLMILGEGQDQYMLEKRIRHYGLDGQVEIFPPRPDMMKELLQTAIYASASRYEGFGLAITEAMECGVPVVAFDCECGPRGIIEHDRDGLLVEPLNTEKFAEAMLKLIESPELRCQFGNNASQSVRRFAPEKIMQQWETLFTSLVQPTRPIHV